MKKKKKSVIPRISLILAFFSVIVLGFLYVFKIVNKNNLNNLSCANSISCIKDLSGNYKENQKEGVFLGKKVAVPSILSRLGQNPTVLGDTTGSQKHIFVDLSSQRLYAYEGNNLVYNFLISSGKWGRTPTGDFRIWVKLRYTTMSGGDPSIGTYYNLPNVPYVMFFYNNEIAKSRGFSLHGTYWHNNFGHPMSHGCVNMRIEDVEKLYYWTTPTVKSNTTYPTTNDPGTLITIYGQAPAE